MSKCGICNDRDSERAAILHGRYYPAVCSSCYNDLSVSGVSSGHADYERGRDAEEHEADIIQPFNGDGSPSAEFIHLYPERAKSMMTPEQLRDAYRK